MPRALAILAHWHHSVENIQASTVEFYDSIEHALKAKDVVGLSLDRVEWNEAGVLTAKRLYLRISYRRFVFDVAAFPFGKDFVWSWWLGKKVPNLAALGCAVIAGVPLLFLFCTATFGITAGITIFILIAFFGVGYLAYASGTGSLGIAEDVHEAMADFPFVGPIYKRLFNPATYYTEDTRMAFEETVHRVVIEVVSGVLAINNLTPLSSEQKAVERKKR